MAKRREEPEGLDDDSGGSQEAPLVQERQEEEAPAGPIDVDLGEAAEEHEAAPPPEPRPEPPPDEEQEEQRERSPNRVPARQRIQQLTHEVRSRDAAIEERDRALAEMQRQYQELANRQVKVDRAAFDAHEAKWRTELDAAESAHRDALKTQDPDAITAATKRMGFAASELQAIGAYKAQFPDQFNPDGTRAPVQQPPQQRFQPQPQTQPQQPVHVPPAMHGWIDRNPWLRHDAQEFDPEMAAYAAHAATILDSRYGRQGRQQEIGSEAYFEDMDRMVQNEFPDAFENGQEPSTQRRQPAMVRPNGAGVAAASRQQPTGQARGASDNEKVRMSIPEYNFMMKMINNGAYSYPKDHPKFGQKMSVEDGKKYHAKFVQRDREQEAAGVFKR